MPVRSVVAIDVQDQKWRTFQESFNKYDTAVRQQPELWAKVSKEHEKLAKTFDQFAASQDKMVSSARQLASHWRDIGGHIASTGASVFKTVGFLEQQLTGMISWISRLTGVSALLGLAGLGGTLYGLDRLASTVGAGRRSSMGLGTTYGGLSAFGLTYNRLVNTGALLGGVSTGLGDISSGSARGLYALGLDPMSGGDTAKTAEAVIRRTYSLVRGQPRGMLGPLSQAYGLSDLGFSLEDLNRLRNTSPGELGQFQKEFTGRSGLFHVDPAVQKAWQDFSNKLSEAAEKLETTLIRTLGPLTGPLTKLTDAFSDFASTILGGSGARTAIEYLTKGLKELAKYLTEGGAKRDWDELLKNIGRLKDAFDKFANFLDRIFGPGGSASTSGPSVPMGTQPLQFDDWLRKKNEQRGALGPYDMTRPEVNKMVQEDYDRYIAGFPSAPGDAGGGAGTPGSRGRSRGRRHFSAADIGAVPDAGMADMMQAISKYESGFNYSALGQWVSQPYGMDRAYGKYQVMGHNVPSWTKQALGYSMSPDQFVNNPQAQEAVFQKIFGDLVKKHGFADATAMWASGQPLSKSANWQVAPGITVADYVARAVAELARITRDGQKIVIHDRQGGNMVSVASGMAAPSQ